MAFLDNSGDIILDAVLTDAGRARLARGDGSFKIVKYAFGDDEIDYSKYNNDHASGSAYYDIDILTSPVFEAFTNNTSVMKSKLLSIPKTNLLYLPIMLLNEVDGATRDSSNAVNMYVVSCDENTDDIFDDESPANKLGVFLQGSGEQKVIAVDQGLNTDAISKDFQIDPTLQETHYIVELDNRLGFLVDPSGNQQAYSYLDDDNVASYNFSSDSPLVGFLNKNSESPLAGPRGSRLSFRIKPSIELNSSTYLFTLLGSTGTWTEVTAGTANSIRLIDSTVRVTGATTGYRIDIPIRFIKKQ